MKNRRLIAVLTATLVSTFGLVLPAQAVGNVSTYLSDPVFSELVTDMGYTAAILSDSSHKIVIAEELINFNNGVPTDQFVVQVAFSSSASAAQIEAHKWLPSSNIWGPVTTTDQFGFANGASYASIDVTNDELSRTALKRLKSTGAKWMIKKNAENLLQVPLYSPFILRPTLTSSTILSSVGELTFQGRATISNLSVSRNLPRAGFDTFMLTSTFDSTSVDFTIVVGSDRVVTSARQDEYGTSISNRTLSSSNELTITDRSSIGEVTSLVGVDDKTVDYLTYETMRSRITSERGITPQATAVANKAKALAGAAKGKNKNVVTAKIIQSAAKALHQTAANTKTGVKLTGALESQDVRGYMCVSALKKKAVVTSC